MTVDVFCAQCQEYLSPQDAATVLALMNGGETLFVNRTARGWNDFNRAIRNELVLSRSKKYALDPATYFQGEREADMRVIDLLEYASEAENPLASEKIIDHFRWALLDDLAQGHFFDLDFLIAYGLKLRIAERYANVATDNGLKRFEEITAITGTFTRE